MTPRGFGQRLHAHAALGELVLRHRGVVHHVGLGKRHPLVQAQAAFIHLAQDGRRQRQFEGGTHAKALMQPVAGDGAGVGVEQGNAQAAAHLLF